ncbi:Uncharacterised protein [Bordetella pertussis]|nr:Uncharacterised protein [Bordetella pertussis]CFP67334.1 Uncharacterised protein [Bordetella pertussis]CFW47732.1 Uncharacterised protein [Bordetella pertussis]
MGSSMAMVGTGPMPGNTPIRVPRMQPSNAYARFSGVNATEKPSIRLSNNSMIHGLLSSCPETTATAGKSGRVP